MFNKIKIKINNEIFALGLLIIITIIFTSYYNLTKTKINNPEDYELLNQNFSHFDFFVNYEE